MSSLPRLLALSTLFFALAAFCACESCHPVPGADGGSPPATDTAVPDARLYLVSDLAGALEPCGCVKDQLGGMDHFGALVAAEKDRAKAYGTLAAGPLFFMDMELAGDRRAQEARKADTIAASMKSVGLLAFTPARNEWANSPAALGKLVAESGAPLLAANLTAPSLAPLKWTIKDVGKVKLGLIGVAAPEQAKAETKLEGVTSSAAGEAVKLGVDALKKEGAQAIVVLAAVGRGEAKRIADVNPEVLAVLVGSTGSNGDANTEAPPAERIGDVLVTETANHLQTVSVLDLYLREGAPKPGSSLVTFADGTGVERIRKREELNKRIDELRKRVATWETDRSVDRKDIDARKADIAKLEAERDAADRTPAPARGSYYRYASREIRDNLGASGDVKAQMLAYYKQVNEANKLEFADRKPKTPAKGDPGYVGIEMCTSCHEAPRKVWDKTAHAHAYATLSTQFKEFNLDCVSCHVTGYDRPGGSTVTHVDDLKDVQCEVCHGPGSLHAARPDKVKIPTPKPGADVCLSCHHPPHVHTFDVKAKMPEILGPGHASK